MAADANGGALPEEAHTALPTAIHDFLHPPQVTVPGCLTMLHLKRDNLIPVILGKGGEESGYAEGAVTNTRFGSFPHSTLFDVEWGSQIRASKVDTGTRGRKGNAHKEVTRSGGQFNVVKQVERSSNKRKSRDVEAEDGWAQLEPSKKLKQTLDAKAFISTNGKRKSQDIEAEVDSAQLGLPKKVKQTLGATALIPTNGIRTLRGAETEEDSSQTTPAKTTKETTELTASVGNTATKAAIEAGSGFIHVLQPTPESWTSSLDHRTQVVYTPDYSYILQRLRVRPGNTLIEAGAGSGSFTHAAVRAVFSGHADRSLPQVRNLKLGRVCSYEYHEPRIAALGDELAEHGLTSTVTLTHRDVCKDGFMLADSSSPSADAVFLDLPAPWQALQHLRRGSSSSPLNPSAPVHLCTFSPCIEQVIATVSAMRKEGWVDIEMVEVQNKRIDVRREQVGLKNEGLRGVNASAATVEEAIGRLREVESKQSDFHSNQAVLKHTNGTDSGLEHTQAQSPHKKKVQTKAERLALLKKEAEERKLYKEGNLVHRVELEVKTHTSYLVLAILPREWTEVDEIACLERWPVRNDEPGQSD